MTKKRPPMSPRKPLTILLPRELAPLRELVEAFFRALALPPRLH
jgi:hypothetical protein